MRGASTVGLLAALPLLAMTGASSAPGIALELPLRCRFGETCFIQQYFDHGPGPAAKDYRCGPMVYDGHDGTDFRVPTRAAQRAGVEVVAAADGQVRGARDDMADRDVRDAGADAVKGRECGNGVAIAHADGWETQYCHMARGSIAVRPGQQVTAGTMLGRVGQSGAAAFPHLHLSVRRAGVKIDPFAPAPRGGSCAAGPSLWSATATRALAYRSPDLLNHGFAPAPVTIEAVEQGETGQMRSDSPALVAFVRAIGLRAGDGGSLAVTGPGGAVIARTDLAPLARDRAQQMWFVGARRTAPRWPKGRYVARLELRRAGAPSLVREFSTQIP